MLSSATLLPTAHHAASEQGIAEKQKDQINEVFHRKLLQYVKQDADGLQQTAQEHEDVKDAVEVSPLLPDPVQHRADRIGDASRKQP